MKDSHLRLLARARERRDECIEDITDLLRARFRRVEAEESDEYGAYYYMRILRPSVRDPARQAVCFSRGNGEHRVSSFQILLSPRSGLSRDSGRAWSGNRVESSKDFLSARQYYVIHVFHGTQEEISGESACTASSPGNEIPMFILLHSRGSRATRREATVAGPSQSYRSRSSEVTVGSIISHPPRWHTQSYIYTTSYVV